MNIWLVWATNVWKSTLFNRLIWQFRAIVTDIAGTTVDNLAHTYNHEDLWKIIFTDSPGLLDFEEERIFIKKIIDQSDILLFVIDDSIGITSKEQHIFQYILETGKKDQTILVANKLDIKRKLQQYETAIAEYYEFGFPSVIGVSAKKDLKTEELREEIKEIYRNKNLEYNRVKLPEENENLIHLAILGKPNAGKSTLLNTLAGKNLSKIEDKAGTTRDYIYTDLQLGKIEYRLYDTAWIKKKWKMRSIEKIAYMKTLSMLKFIKPMVIFMIDATEGMTHRDMSLIQEINDIGLPIIIMLNKDDLLTSVQRKTSITKTQRLLDFAKYIPILPLTATSGEGKNDMLKMLKSIRKEFNKRIDTSEMNKIIAQERIQRPPRFPKNKVCKIMYATQIETRPPAFLFFINHKKRANFAFKKRIDNSIRKHYGFIWTPLKIYFRERSEKDKSKKNYYNKQFEE